MDIYRETDSTNRIAQALGDAGAPEGTLVLADGQTAGRGRLGRSFFSPAGCSLYFSLLLRPDLPPEAAHRHTFVASYAVAEAIRALLPEYPIEIKWPNDILLGGRKTCGINLPARIEDGRLQWLVLGIGVNVNLQAQDIPDELQAIATSLRIAAGHTVDRLEFAHSLFQSLEMQLDAFRRDGFEGVLDGWLKYFRMEGRRVHVGGPGISEEIDGIVEGVDEEGALLVRTDKKLERILAGDVTLAEEGNTTRAAGD